jgi:thymidylate synthase (FAD)
MEVKLIAHTKLSESFIKELNDQTQLDIFDGRITDGQAVALTAIRTCYSHLQPSEIVDSEASKYFGKVAKDGQGGTEADRLIRHIINSGHTSTMEHINFTFAIEGVSRSLLAQLTRHRHFSYSVQSQRYVKFGSDDKVQGFDYIKPPTVSLKTKDDGYELDETGDNNVYVPSTNMLYDEFMDQIQEMYDKLRQAGVPAEDARYILPNAATCNLTLTGNLRSILEFYGKRNPTTHAQWEIQELAEKIKEEVIKAEPWTESFFNDK